MGFGLNDKKKDGGIKDVFGASPNMALQYNRGVALEGLDKIVDDYATLNAWSASNLNISGTDTTYLDYKAVHNLVNPAAANQATFDAANSNFNNEPTLSYTTDDYNYKLFNDYLIGKSTGTIHIAFRTSADVTSTSYLFSSSETAASVKFYSVAISAGKLFFLIQNSTMASDRYQVSCDTTSLVANTNYVASITQTGSEIKILINSTAQTLGVVVGTATTHWFSDVSDRVNISIGASVRSAITYSELTNGFIQITDDFADATVLANHNDIKTFYAI